MTIAPHPDSGNSVLVLAESYPTKELEIKYQNENVENAEFWAFAIAFLISTGLAFYYTDLYYPWNDWALRFKTVFGWFGSYLCFLFIRWILLTRLFFMPGNIIQDVPSDR